MRGRRSRVRQAGFTLIEVLVAMMIMTIGLVGVVAMQKGAYSASGFSRRATEAAVLGEDKLEQLRTIPINTATEDSDTIDASGVVTVDGPFTRTWTFEYPTSVLLAITVTVSWTENDGTHTITFHTLRNLN
jgi:type IV pilus assembly protein PilV